MAIPANIEQFKAVLSRRNGLAQQNYFSVFMSLPLLSIDPANILEGGLSGQTNASQMLNDPRDVGFLCESCNIPGRTISTQDYQTVRQPIKMPYSFMNEDVTFSFLLTQDYYMKEVFDDWMSKVMDFENYKLKYKTDYTSDVIIEQLTKQGVPTYTVKLENAYPIAVSAIDLSQEGSNTIQKISVTLTYDNHVKEDIFSSAVDKARAITEQIKNAPRAIDRARVNTNNFIDQRI